MSLFFATAAYAKTEAETEALTKTKEGNSAVHFFDTPTSAIRALQNDLFDGKISVVGRFWYDDYH